MADVWKYDYKNNHIEVINDSDTDLIINDQLQDRKSGIRFSVELSGHLDSGEIVKASIGGVFGMKCSLFIDDKLIEPVAVE